MRGNNFEKAFVPVKGEPFATVKKYKQMDWNEFYDVVVVGAGHAGCEAALATARLGKKTLILTIEMESVAMMPCNPAIGGTGKGQLVKEIDALGGEMALNIDKTFIQSRMLNVSKGPAVHSPRAQADKQRYHAEMLNTLSATKNLHLVEGEVIDLLLSDPQAVGTQTDFQAPDRQIFSQVAPAVVSRRVVGVLLRDGRKIAARVVILATGTYLNGLLHISDRAWQSGPSGLAPSLILAENLKKHGLKLRRFKTGTPARAMASTLDYAKMQKQEGDDKITPFSYMNDEAGENKISCWLTYTNEESHRIVADNIRKTAPYGGYTTGVGPRYCLSIEDKVSRFPDRKRHQLFLEPEGLSTEDVYIQGMSTSLPEDIQEQFYRSIDGLAHAKFSKYAYSIEYDCLDPLTLRPSLEHREIQGLYCAGQINGSSGYEEAAAQGIIAGINAARALGEEPPWVPDRSEAYIGVLIDDLVTKGTDEPYRIMTSRAEFRLVLRQDNADLRLTEKGYEIGLASEERFQRCQKKKQETEAEIKRLYSTWLSGVELKKCLFACGQADAEDFEGRISFADLIKRPGIGYDEIAAFDRETQNISEEAKQQAAIQIKYQGYIDKQMKQIERFKKLEGKKLPPELDYESIRGIRIEAVQKLSLAKPVSIGQASRISGVSPADINVLLVHLLKLENKKKAGLQEL